MIPQEVKYTSIDSNWSKNSLKQNRQEDELDLASTFQSSFSQTKTSFSTDSYHQILQDPSMTQRNLKELISQLQLHGISFNSKFSKKFKSSTFNFQIQILSLQHTKYFQIVSLNVSLGPYSQKIQVYNTFQPSIFNKQFFLFNGKSTKIYSFVNQVKDVYAAKCISFSNHKQFGETFKRKQFVAIVKEFFITKMMSSLQIGLKVSKDFGFDIFLSDLDAFFILEKCQDPKTKNFDQKDARTLKQSLKQMHLLSIAHKDIKPDNIMYSPSYGKFVFIDFGMSDFLLEQIGYQSYTCFAGTYNYCTQQMKNLFLSREAGWVDLYLNDANGLSLSITQLENNQTIKSTNFLNFNQDKKFVTQKNDAFFIEVRLKNMLYRNDFKESIMLNKSSFPIEKNKIINFLYQIPLTEKIRQIYNKFLYFYLGQPNEDLKVYLENKVYIQRCRGKRQFQNLQEKQRIQLAQKFYKNFEADYCKVKKYKFKELSIEKIEEVIFDELKIKQLKQGEYQVYLIEYLSFKRIRNIISLEKKREACLTYMKYTKKDDQIPDYPANLHFRIANTILNVLYEMEANWISDNFYYFVKGIENCFYIVDRSNLKCLKLIQHLIQITKYDDNLNSLEKDQRLTVCYFLSRIKNQMYFTSEERQSFNKIDEKIFDAIGYSTSCNFQIFGDKYYPTYGYFLNLFFIRKKFNLHCDPKQLLDTIIAMKPESKEEQELLLFMKYHLCCKVPDPDQMIRHQLGEVQEIIWQKMMQDNEINSLLIFEIQRFFRQISTKKFIKYFKLYRSCINIEGFQGFTKDLLHEETLYFRYDQEENLLDYSPKNERMLHIWLKIAKCWQIENISFEYYDYYQNQRHLASKHEKQGELKPRHIPISPKTYQTDFHIGLHKFMERHIDTGDVKIQNRVRINYYIYNHEQEVERLNNECLNMSKFNFFLNVLAQTQTFKELMKFDRTFLDQSDHIKLLFYDIQYIAVLTRTSRQVSDSYGNKKIQYGPANCQKILEYLISRQKIIKNNFTITSSYNKVNVFNAINLMFMNLQKENNLVNITKSIDFIYPLLKGKCALLRTTTELHQYLIKFLARIYKFQEVFEEIYEICSSLVFQQQTCIPKIFIMFQKIVNQIDPSQNGQTFFIFLKYKIAKNPLKENPNYLFFLANCIRSFNRKKLVNILILKIHKIRPIAKDLINGKIYIESMRLKKISSKRKNKLIARRGTHFRDVFFPLFLKINLVSDFPKKTEDRREQFVDKIRQKMKKYIQNVDSQKANECISALNSDDKSKLLKDEQKKQIWHQDQKQW